MAGLHKPDVSKTPPPPSLPITLKDRDAIRERVTSLVESAQREIIVFAPQMDTYFFNGSRMGQALTGFALRHRHNRTRLLIEDGPQVLHDNNRLIALCRRLSEFIQLRQVGEQHLGLREMFIVADGVSYLQQPDVTEPECVVEPAGRR